jgi:hypothetical protein
MASSFDRATRALSFITVLATAAACLFAHPAPSLAENFRIETKVFEGKAEQPTSEAVTLFCNGVVYDFLKEPAQTAIFSKPNGKNAGRFILLDDTHQIRTEFSTAQLEGVMKDLRTWASEQPQKYLKFAANPDFKESFEPGSGQLVLASHFESYTVETTSVKRPKATSEYREFLDWYTQLNALLTASPPPQPRLELNKSLSRHKVIPKTVELTRAGSDEPLRAEHEFKWLLSQDDMARIEEAKAAMASYRPVTNGEYLESTRPAEDEE